MGRRHKQATVQTDPGVRFFRLFVVNALVCVAGLSTLVYVHLLLPPSVEQEWYALGGIVLAIPSGLCALYCYVRLLLSRLTRFFAKDKDE